MMMPTLKWSAERTLPGFQVVRVGAEVRWGVLDATDQSGPLDTVVARFPLVGRKILLQGLPYNVRLARAVRTGEPFDPPAELRIIDRDGVFARHIRNLCLTQRFYPLHAAPVNRGTRGLCRLQRSGFSSERPAPRSGRRVQDLGRAAAE